VADAKDENDKRLVLERADYAVVSNSIFPEFAERPLETLSDFSWIVELPTRS
jgi:hypothetical protein